jgi:hypothetical protein
MLTAILIDPLGNPISEPEQVLIWPAPDQLLFRPPSEDPLFAFTITEDAALWAVRLAWGINNEPWPRLGPVIDEIDGNVRVSRGEQVRLAAPLDRPLPWPPRSPAARALG